MVGRHPFASRLLFASGILFLVSVMWSLSSPVPSGPDEEAQLIKAAAVARGTLIGPTVAHHRSTGVVLVKVPKTLQSASAQSACDYFTVAVPACKVTLHPSSKLVAITTYEGRYPPLYYAITGLPTLVSSSAWMLHAMRVMSALVVSLLLGAAFACVSTYGRSGLLTLATGLVVTPTVIYIGALVNPSATEIAGGLAMWAALAVLFFHRADDPPVAVAVTAAVGAMAMSASRPLSTLFYALIIASFVVLRPTTARALLRRRLIRVAFGVSLVFAFFSGVYVLYAKSYELEAFPIPKETTSGYILSDLGHSEKVLRQVIGSFGAPDFSVPIPLLAIWLVAGFGIILAAFVLASRRDALLLAGLTAILGFVLPFVIIYSHIQTDGVIWQGRYSLPLLVGLPMLAAALIAERHPVAVRAALPRTATIALTAFAVGQIGAYYWFLRRYTVGLSPARTNAFGHAAGAWTPPVPPILLFAFVVIGNVVFGLWLLRQILVGGDGGRRQPGIHARRRTPPDAVRA